MRGALSTILVLAVLGSAVVRGHHSSAAFFLLDETIVIEGVVTEFWFANPHSRIYLEVTNESGAVEEWMAEGGARNVLLRRGWTEDTISPGMELIITGNPSRDGSNSVEWGSVTSSDGAEVGP